MTDDRAVERRVEARVAEIMSSAGMSSARIAHELLYLMPRDFRDVYVELFHEALGGTAGAEKSTGGSTEAQGSTSRKAEVGRVSRGKRPYKRYWVVNDERLLAVKERVDKRLRAIAREIRAELEWGESRGRRAGKGGSLPAGRRVCRTCSRFVALDWRFCPTCGTNLEDVSD